MKFRKFSIRKNEGVSFSKKSGDYNDIHLNKLVGYNSMFGSNIVHGSYLIIKLLEKISYKKFSKIKIRFDEAFFYNNEIKFCNKKINNDHYYYELFQDNELKATFEFSLKDINLNQNIYKNKKYKKIFYLSKKKENKLKTSKLDKNLYISLTYLSRYVGMYYPGKYSLITEILIKKIKSNEKKIKKNKKIEIKSYKPDSRFPLIENILLFREYKIYFKTVDRPKLNLKFQKLNKRVLNSINKINKNILIIGASSGIGYELLNIFKNNSKIKIIATYNNNKIKIKKKNIIIKKINVSRNLKQIKKTIIKFSPLIIYYFATPKIKIFSKRKNLIDLYKSYFIKIPLKIIYLSKKYNNYFFYPSTKFIDKNIKSNYVKIKLLAERILKKIKTNETKINIARIPEINTKQNLSLVNRNLPNFSDILKKDNEIYKKIFFTNLKKKTRVLNI